mmetsp:Transcript_30514/g.30826  ORF Transcript_30514/g.30826 Transcript_30514/m.30826 type:complete len:84 (+) Transcript_30514:718-969(+)
MFCGIHVSKGVLRGNQFETRNHKQTKDNVFTVSALFPSRQSNTPNQKSGGNPKRKQERNTLCQNDKKQMNFNGGEEYVVFGQM